MRTAGKVEMVVYACLQTSRPESTADIGIKSGFKEKGAKFADADRLLNRRDENQCICTWQRVHDRGSMLTNENKMNPV
jgi:hypothetical protein